MQAFLKPRLDGEGIALAVLVVFIFLVSVLPAARLVLEAFAPGGDLDLSNLSSVLSAGSTWRATWHSLATSIFGTAISLVLGTAFALAVALTDIRAKAALVFAFLLPLMIPPQVTALSWAQLAGPSSPLLITLGVAPPLGAPNPFYSAQGIILLLGIQHAPLVFLAVRAGLRYEFGGGGGDGFGFGKGKGKGPEPVYASTPLYEEPAPLYEEPIYK